MQPPELVGSFGRIIVVGYDVRVIYISEQEDRTQLEVRDDSYILVDYDNRTIDIDFEPRVIIIPYEYL